jgi:hypothetical protein
MAAATIEARRWSFRKYQEIWKGHRAGAVGWARQEITGYHHAVAETWQTSVHQPTPTGRELLQRLAFLAPEPVPEWLLAAPVSGAPAADAPHAALDDLARPAILSPSQYRSHHWPSQCSASRRRTTRAPCWTI